MCSMKLKTLIPESSTQIHHLNNTKSDHNLKFPLINLIGQCQYKNEVNFEKILVDNHQDPKIKIINQLCTEKGDMLEKITSIKFGDQIITIKDLYHFQRLGPRLVTNVEKKRIHLFKKNVPLEQGINVNTTRITKNLPKNFIKAFLNYLQDIKNQQNKELIECKLKLFFWKEKFNNSLIRKIVDDEQLQPYFKDFLQNYAQQWIRNSKISNKKTHLQAIPIFLNLKSQNKNTLKPQQTNSDNHSNQQKKQQQFNFNNQQYQQNLFQQRKSQRDSILANQSKNYCFDQK